MDLKKRGDLEVRAFGGDFDFFERFFGEGSRKLTDIHETGVFHLGGTEGFTGGVLVVKKYKIIKEKKTNV